MIYDQSVIKPRVIAGLCSGKSLSATCREEGMPDPATIIKWCSADPEFALEYDLAQAVSIELLVDEIIEIADEPPQDMPGEQRRRARIDSRKWIACKRGSRKYGERSAIEHSGATTIQVVTGIPPRES